MIPKLRAALIATSCLGPALVAGCPSLSDVTLKPACNQYGTLALGATVTDSITPASCELTDRTYAAFYRLAVTSQTRLRLSLSSPLASTYLSVADSSGQTVANSSVTSTADTAATLRMIVKPGRYQVGVITVATYPSGPLSLSTASDTLAVRGCVPIWVTTGIATTQTLTTSDCTLGPQGANYYYHVYWTAILNAEDLVLTEHATAFPPETWILDATGIAQGHSEFDSLGNNGLVDYAPPSHTYLQLWVGSSNQLAVGAYALTIQ